MISVAEAAKRAYEEDLRFRLVDWWTVTAKLKVFFDEEFLRDLENSIPQCRQGSRHEYEEVYC